MYRDVLLEAILGPSTNLDMPGPGTNPAMPGPSTYVAMPGLRAKPFMPGPSTSPDMPGHSTNPAMPGLTTNQAMPGPAPGQPFLPQAQTQNCPIPMLASAHPFPAVSVLTQVYKLKRTSGSIQKLVPEKKYLERKKMVQKSILTHTPLNHPFTNSHPKETWMQCVRCNKWPHDACTSGQAIHVCQRCNSEDKYD